MIILGVVVNKIFKDVGFEVWLCLDLVMILLILEDEILVIYIIFVC